MPHLARSARTRIAGALVLGVCWIGGAAMPDAARAATGVAAITPAAAVPAGSQGAWTLTYTATADFARPQGGTLLIQIPPGWTAPQVSDSLAPGFVKAESFVFVDSVDVSGQTIRVHVGAPPKPRFKNGDSVSLIYGAGGGPATAPTVAPGTSTFFMSSDTCDCGVFIPVLSQKYLTLVPDVVDHIRIVDAIGVPIGARSLSADQDTTQLFLEGYDRFDNPARPVTGIWSVLGGIGATSPVTGASTVFSPGTAGTGYVAADSGAWSDSTGLFTVTAGPYAGLRVTASPAATAGAPFTASVNAVDEDGNPVVSGPGSGASVVFRAYANPSGATPANPGLSSPGAVLGGGIWSGSATALHVGTFYLASLDTTTGIESSPRAAVAVAAAAPDSMSVLPDTLRLVAGVPGVLTLHLWDAFGNRAPVAAAEVLTLWTDRPAGHFENLSGAPIYELTVPAGADSIAFRFVDLQTTTAPGRLRVIDADGVAPSLETVGASALTAPNAPAGSIALTATPAAIVANGVDSTKIVSGPVHDAYGNAVAAGERFAFSGALVSPITDDDPGAAGAQLLAAADGTLSGWARAGVVKGSGSASLVSERGSASGSAPVSIAAGVPAGMIAVLASPDSVAGDSASVRAATATGLDDANGNTVEDGEPYTVSTTLGAILSADADPGTPGIQVPATSGAIAFQLFGGDVLGTATISVASVRGSAAGFAAVRVVPGAVSATRSTVAAVSPVPVGPAGSTITVTLRDSQDHPLAGVTSDSIAVAVTGAAASVAPLAAATDASGAIGFRATATVPGSGVVSAIARGVALIAAPTVVFQPGPLDHYVVSGPAGPLAAGVASSLLVEARDAFGNALPARSGDVLHPTATAGAATLPLSVLLASGAATIPFTPTLAAPLTIQVADDSSHSVSYGPTAIVAGAPYRLVAVPPAPGTLAAGDSVAVRGRLFDANGNAVPAGSVTAGVVVGGGSVAPAADATDGSGYADFTLRAGPATGSLTLRLVAAGSVAPDSIRADSITVTVVPASVASIQVAAAPGSAAAGDSVSVTLTLRDAFGNVAAGATPTLWLRTTTASASPDHVRWSLGPGATGALADTAASDGATYAFSPADAGVATLRLRDTLVETIRARASGGTLPAAESGDVAFAPGAPSTIAILSGDLQTGVAGRTLALPLRAQVRDAFGNASPGAVVAFRVTAGNGSVDVVPGGALDSLATTDPSGVATCAVARLGPIAGAGNNGFRAGLSAVPAAAVVFTASAVADTAAALALAPGSLSLPAAGTATVTVTARDLYGNLAAGAAITFYLGSPALGTLESLGGTSGGAGSQSGVTGVAGTLDVRYRAPNSAPAADSIFARGVTVSPVGIRATVASAATASLRVLPDSLAWTAGSSVRVRVQALDAFGNLAPSDTATVVMRASGGVIWSPPFGGMVAGEFVTFGRDTLAENIVIAADRTGGGTGSAGPAVVRPAPPSGVIPISATRTTLTADGRSTATATLGPVRDAFGNLEPAGTLLLASAQAGSLLAPDASPLPGLDLALDANALASVVLTAPSAAGGDALLASSRAGTASGGLAFTYVPPPTLAYASGSLAPQVVVPGSTAAFSLAVRNTGSGAIQLGAGTTLSFAAAPEAYAAMLASPVALPPGATDTLRFASAAVSATLTPGTYAPSLRAVGIDGTGEAFDFYPSLAGAQVHAAGVDVAAVSATPSTVPLGYANLALVFDVHNPTGVAATITAASLATSIGAFAVNSVTPALPAALPAGATVPLGISVLVPTSGIAAGTVVDARLTATAAFGASSVVGTNAPPLSFGVVSAAQVVAVTGGATPPRYLRSRSFLPTARVANSGAGITLSRGTTQLLLVHPGGDRLTVGLAAATAVAGGDTAALAFDSLAVPATVARGRYAASLLLDGVEAGQAFTDTIPLDPDSVSVLDPPILTVSAPVSPATVSAGQSRPVSVTLTNSGDVPFDLDPATSLAFGAPVSVSMSLGGAPSLGPGGSIVLSFTGAPLGSPLAPGTAAATLETRGFEDGRYREQSIAAGALDALPPALITFVPGSAAPDTVRAGQSYDVTVSVRNDGGSPFLLDPAASRLLITDGVESVNAPGAGAPFLLAPNAQANLSFPSAAFPAALASQAYPVALDLQGSEWGLAASIPVASPPGEILVREPAPAVQVRGFGTAAPVQVAPGTAAVTVWGLEVTPLVPPGGVTSARLAAVRLAALVDGAATTAPGATIASLTLRSPSGQLLAQASPPAGNPIVLPLPTPLPLSSGAETLYVEVSIQGAAAAQSLALRLETSADLVVLDDLTSLPVPVTAGGGLPFSPLTSPVLTLFARPHGYPNPFHAGGESVRLSYVLAQSAPVTVTIYTLLGDKVRVISAAAGGSGGMSGLNELLWDGRNGSGDLVVPGVYVASIEGGGVHEQVKVGVLR